MTRTPRLLRIRNLILERILFRIMFAGSEGVSIFREDWQNLVILDACRYDVFRESLPSTNLRGKLKCAVSKGSETQGFLKSNFVDSKYDDIVYVTGNPFVSKLLQGRFYQIIPVWKTSWDKNHQTVMPKALYEAAMNASREFPGKRLIIHFLQPHQPYLDLPPTQTPGTPAPFHIYCAKDWYTYHRNIIGTPLLERLYRGNLMQALPWVERLVAGLPGRTIITSDHGETFGEYLHPLIPFRVFGHIERVRIPSMVRVPWLVAERLNGSLVGSAKETAQVEYLEKSDEGILEERLKALGYS